jgi:hypothetical protein
MQDETPTPDEMEQQAIEDEGAGIVGEAGPEYVDPSQEQVEGDPDGDDQDQPHQKLEAGLGPFGIMVRANALNGDTAQVNLTPDEAFTFAGHMIALGTVLMQMSIQVQMQEQARIQAMLQGNPEKRTESGIVLKR